mmetsp:Transcript_17255/g.45650  ORF Transcript_17255/g.45650 Transcript_17255/m.45650 type:complete len:212 (+) Transcript_17255:1474-2109(+)
MALNWDLSCFIFCIFSCFCLVMSSAFFIALCAFESLVDKKESNLVMSSSSICCDLFRASSFALALSSSLTISAFLTSKLICTRNISLFLATNSCTFSFSRRESRPTDTSMRLPPRPLEMLSSGTSSGPGSTRKFLATREQAVVFSQTCCAFRASLSSARLCLSCSRMTKIWSSGGTLNGFSSAIRRREGPRGARRGAEASPGGPGPRGAAA